VQEELALHRSSVRKLARDRVTLAAPSANFDAGNIAVLEDDGGVIARRNDFTLNNRLLRFQPLASDASKYGYELDAASYDSAAAAAGTQITLADDDSQELQLPFPFPFFGAQFSKLHINSDGNLTFLSTDASSLDRSLGRMISGPPRIAPFFRDLDPSVSGAVKIFADANIWIATWVAVPEYSSFGSGIPQTFQVKLYPDGKIEFVYQSASSQEAVVGIAPGNAAGVARVVSFTGDASSEYTGAVAERFTTSQAIDIVFASQKFFEKHEDSYDYLVIYNNLGIAAAPGAVAYEVTVRNNNKGYGTPVVDSGKAFGSARRLQAVLNLGSLTQYPADPRGIVPARFASGDTPLSILSHEAGHLFLAFASVRDAVNPVARPMLGIQNAHWSFTFNADASFMEGNRIQDNGAGANPRFLTTASVQQYSKLDQYLMGFLPPHQVPPTFLVTNASVSTTRFPQPGIGFNGNRRDVTIDELIEVETRRTPDSTVAQRHYRFGFVLVTDRGTVPDPADLAKLEAYRSQFESYFNQAAAGNGFADTTIKKNLHLSVAPSVGVTTGADVQAMVRIASSDTSPLSIQLTTQNGLITTPSLVTIPAGETQATFSIHGVGLGVEELMAEPADTSYAAVHARIQVSNANDVAVVAYAGNNQNATAGQPLSEPVVIQATDQNGLPYPGITIQAAVSPGGTVQPSSAVTDEGGRVEFRWTPGAGPVHELKASFAGEPVPRLIVNAVGEITISTGGVVNAASLAANLTPGGIASLYGVNFTSGNTYTATLPLPTILKEVQVLVNGRAMALLYAGDRQINFVVPLDMPLGPASVVVKNGTKISAAAGIGVVANDPGVFATIVRGEFLEIYCTGLGVVEPSSRFGGLFETTAQAVVTLGGVPAEVLYSGLTATFPGLYQINIRIPQNVSPNSPIGIIMR
jgi:uncharacterized protein (TIGR03437 family)